MSIRLVTGGVRSGKSRFAEQLCASLQDEVIYLATSRVLDAEMEERVAKHRAERPANWKLIEEPIQLAEAIHEASPSALLLVECISAWVANLLFAEKLDEEMTNEMRNHFLKKVAQKAEELLQSLEGREAVLVTSEAGLGGVAMHPVSRLFQDALGEVNQRLAQEAEEVWLVISGVPWRVKG
ncbi:bifunctional adenosylcobinamide kinase/adenosylcobinamide-phosphate guanylyltransferase [Thermoflavimicrobium dichotomicum]|uniref:Adenosylcobinamide kinase n=1 Tax=Thermoflavimicrobium dichotomicum TaxID=46223 RepID=A0A1I3MIH3_9BACL|nr:bifunctional adenosylcobinamide kinase/adenosylcobinamide-phosphate guanylyltransferase [Thermoflavimicrobium dichotomicum]SFI96515.1 adenosylcobinamide kinase / adenosylcobinamide-phosphate guanylyltransferase [Thermoflavimicrobium dichotomicum]